MAKHNLKAMDPRKLSDALAAAGLKATGAVKDRAAALAEHYEQQSAKDPSAILLDCTTCGAASPHTLPACPFCGDDGVEAGSATALPAKAEPDAEEPEKSEAEEPAEPEKSEAEEPAEPEAEEPGVAAQERPVDAPAGGKVVEVAATGQTLVKVAKRRRADAHTVDGEIVSPAPSGSIADLDDAIDAVRRLQRNGAECVWELGREIFRIYEGRLYEHRKNEDGTTKFKTWTSFCLAELEIDPSHSYRLMDVGASFTREQIERIGPTKLGFIVRLPEEERAKVLEGAATATTRQVLAEVRELAKGKRRTSNETRRDGFKGRLEEHTKKEPKQTIACVIAFGIRRIPMLARQVGDEPERAARKLNDEPHAQDVLENGVIANYRIATNAEGQIELIVEYTRAAAKPDVTPTKRGRGRPKGSKNKPKEPGEPATSGKKRGRPKGSKNKPKK